MRKLDMTQS